MDGREEGGVFLYFQKNKKKYFKINWKIISWMNQLESARLQKDDISIHPQEKLSLSRRVAHRENAMFALVSDIAQYRFNIARYSSKYITHQYRGDIAISRDIACNIARY